MTSLLLSLLVPSVTADKGEKALPLGAANPLDPAQDMPISFKEVLAMMDRYGAEAKTVAQIRQELQSLAQDARAQAHAKFLAELADGDTDANAFAGMTAIPGLIPLVAQANYHAVAAVVDAPAEVKGLPVTSIPLQSMPLDAYASPEDQLTGAMEPSSLMPEPASNSESLPAAAYNTMPVVNEENLSAPATVSSEVSSESTPLPQANQPVAEMAEVVSPLPPLDDVPEISAGDLSPLTERGSVDVLAPVDASSSVNVTTQALASQSMIDVMTDASKAPVMEEAPAIALNEPRGNEKNPISPFVQNTNDENKADKVKPEISEDPLKAADDKKGDLAAKEPTSRSEKAAENITERHSNRPVALPPGFERVDPFAMALDRAAPGIALASPNGRPFDSAIAQDPQMVQVQAEIRHGQPMGDQLRVHIRSSVAEGHDQIRIHLKPETLGSIDISIQMNDDGSAQVRVIADRSETFDLLQRDARGLERALADAGIKADSGSLQFQLRGESQNQQANGQAGMGDGRGYGQRGDGQQQGNASQRGTAQEIVEIEDNGMYRLVATTGLNIRV
jgi:flagellar hook-length control protein FliK